MTLSLLLEASASLLTAVANHSHLCDVLPVVCQLHPAQGREYVLYSLKMYHRLVQRDRSLRFGFDLRSTSSQRKVYASLFTIVLLNRHSPLSLPCRRRKPYVWFYL
jgi:hypothetical protein